MPRKALKIQIVLDLQAVTCPGVWLCPNGKVSLQLYMLDSCIQTTALPPIFPLLYNEQFIFYKFFYSTYSLLDVQSYINQDFIYAELIQWQCDTGNVIASFQTILHDVLYPSSCDGLISGIDVDLLMEPSKNFPGILAPKIELSTRTTIEEIVCSEKNKKSKNYVIHPKTIQSDCVPCGFRRKSKPIRQKKVCHSHEYHRTCINVYDEQCGAYPMECRQNELQISPSLMHQCEESEVKPLKRKACVCGSGHSAESCPVCTKYSSYFEIDQMVCRNNCNSDVACLETNPCKLEGGSDVPGKTPINTKRLWAYSISNSACHNSPVTYDESRSREDDCYQLGSVGICNRSCIRSSKCCKPSVAKKIHDRFKQTLYCNPPYSHNCERQQQSSGTVSASCTPKFRNCDQGFYKNLGRFYKELYRC
ncbi:hypothetical protein FQA39_LY06630 [Lamprigera yunnana]|nr:hypothetical protein FQA39_LY06630 [Lamprigera yunnana]